MRPVVAIVTGLDGYQMRLLHGISSVLTSRRVPLIVHANDPFVPGASSLLVALLRHGRPLGVITSAASAASEEAEILGLTASLNVPMVRVGIRHPEGTWVHGDNRSGMRALMTHLLEERGVRRIALVRGISHQIDSCEREQVVREELARHGGELDQELVVDGAFAHDQAYSAVRALLSHRRDMDAVVAMNDVSALGALGALADEGLHTPEDVLVTGFDNDQVALQWPGLTTVDQQLEEQGRQAATALIALLEGGIPLGEIVVPSRLVVRGSTAVRGSPPACELPNVVRMARAAQSQLATQDAVLGINRAMTHHCRTLEEVVRALACRLDRLGVRRCFLLTMDCAFEPDSVRSDQVRVALAYNGRRIEHTSTQPFSPVRLLPEELRSHLLEGMLILQPLTMIDRRLGYVLFEPTHDVTTVAETLRMDLSRTLDTVATAREMERHTVTLERLVALRTAELETVNAELRRSVMLDGLTRIANRVAFDRHLAQHWTSLAAQGQELAVLMIDVDLFKAFNDHYGHMVGDEALRTVAACLETCARDERDLSCRYGGEEFALLLPGAGVETALAVAERVRLALVEAAIPHEASEVAPVVTVSIGVAVRAASAVCPPETVVDAADRALYQAKAAGRDRVAVAGRGEESLPRQRVGYYDELGHSVV